MKRILFLVCTCVCACSMGAWAQSEEEESDGYPDFVKFGYFGSYSMDLSGRNFARSNRTETAPNGENLWPVHFNNMPLQ
jgi:hypothetical protein